MVEKGTNDHQINLTNLRLAQSLVIQILHLIQMLRAQNPANLR